LGFNDNKFISPLFKLFGKPLAGVPPNPSNLDIIQFNSTTGKWELVSGVIGSAVQTSSNVGTGDGLALARVGDDLPFKSILAGAGININSLANEIEIVADQLGFAIIKDETLGADTDAWNITSIPTRNFWIVFLLVKDDTGDLNLTMAFNGLAGTPFAYRRDQNFGTITSVINDSAIELDPASVDSNEFHILEILNLDQELKQIFHKMLGDDGGGSGSVPSTQETFVKSTTLDQYDEINIVNTGSGDIDAGSRIVILGSPD